MINKSVYIGVWNLQSQRSFFFWIFQWLNVLSEVKTASVRSWHIPPGTYKEYTAINTVWISINTIFMQVKFIYRYSVICTGDAGDMSPSLFEMADFVPITF